MLSASLRFPLRPHVSARSESKRMEINSDRFGSRYRSAASRSLNGESVLKLLFGAAFGRFGK